MPKSINIFISLLFLLFGTAACGKSKKTQKQETEVKILGNEVDWKKVPSEFNPQMDEELLNLSSAEKLDVDLFGFNKTFDVTYSDDVQLDSFLLRIYTVWAKQARRGTLSTRSLGSKLSVSMNGMYQCSINIENSEIKALEGLCIVKVEVVMPSNSRVEVYRNGELMTDRYIPMSLEEFLTHLDDASFDDRRLELVGEFVFSYQATQSTLSLKSRDLGRALKEFSFGKAKLKALRQLHSYVEDRENLDSMIDDSFVGTFEKEDARDIVGI